jgi:hypothetical protein
MFDFPPMHVQYIDTASYCASIIKIPTEQNKSTAYQDLVCTDQDQAVIYEIITTMSEHGKLSLLLKQSHLKGLGSQINHLHPLKFLSTIVMHPRLRECLVDVFDDYFKRNGFMDGIGPSLTREADKGKLDQYIQDFAQEVNVPKEHLYKYFQNQDWEGLVRYFIHSH